MISLRSVRPRAALFAAALLVLAALSAAFPAPRQARADSLILPGHNTHAVDEAKDDEEKPHTFIPVDEGLAVGIGFGVSNGPYIGMDTDWIVLPVISYEGRYAYIRGATAGIKLINEPFFELSTFVGYDDTELKSADVEHAVRSRYATAVAGLEARLFTPLGLLGANASGDILGHSNGFTGSFYYTYGIGIGDLEIDPGIGLAWSSDKYNNYYYGINESEAERNEIDPYKASSGVAPFVSLTATYAITEHWAVFLDGQFRWLDEEVKASPMVERQNTYTITSGVFYAF